MKELEYKKSLLENSNVRVVLLLLLFFSVSCANETVENKVEEVNLPVATLVKEITIDTIQQAQDTIKYTKNADGYIELTWKHLEEVDFIERYTEEIENYVPYPVFRPSVQRLSGQKIEIQGYVIPVEETGEESIIVLSANPFSACFFCGMAGPETIMDIKLKRKFKNKFKQDDIITFRGTMKLNDSDLYYLNYILEGAELVL
ncbi:MAG: hypothetical protein ACI85O_003410 [Saprospiraceae bacterium]|jgi:hypothetical protein